MTTHIPTARKVLKIEADALLQMAEGLTDEFDRVVEHLKHVKGRIVLAGVGKSGHVARKIAATLASTGSPALYVHPTEASHGDMGMITQQDAVIALSRSGETKELADIIGYCRRFSVCLIAITGNRHSALGQAADHILWLPDAPEACGETRAPTTSTTLQIALGDALAVSLLEAKGFTALDFKTYHPGGALGASLLTVGDLMHTDQHLPLIDHTDTFMDALEVMSKKGFGCVGITQNKELIGIITDGDIRRQLSNHLVEQSVSDIMTANPQTAQPHDLAADILRRMTASPVKIMQIFVINSHKQPMGIVHLHDFLRAGLM